VTGVERERRRDEERIDRRGSGGEESREKGHRRGRGEGAE
jgi:hypothetical protein